MDWMRNRRAILLILSLTQLLFGMACGKDYVTGKGSYNWFGLDQDVRLGKEVLYEQLAAFQKGAKYEGKVVEVDVDTEQMQRIQTVVDRIAKVSHLPNLPYEAHLADIPVVNAWCAPGGKIMVYSGLWDPKKGLISKDNDAELAAVLAHEMAHANARHVTEMLSTNMTILLAGTVAQSAIGAAGSQMGSNLFGSFFSYGYNIFAPTYSRKAELEADRIGLFYMAKAGYDPQVAIQVWERASKKKGDMTTIYASHPGSGERAKALQQYLPLAEQIYHDPSLPYPNFANMKKAAEAKAKTPANTPEKGEAPSPETQAAPKIKISPKTDL
jgi:predicted Zn-dependent protease